MGVEIVTEELQSLFTQFIFVKGDLTSCFSHNSKSTCHIVIALDRPMGGLPCSIIAQAVIAFAALFFDEIIKRDHQVQIVFFGNHFLTSFSLEKFIRKVDILFPIIQGHGVGTCFDVIVHHAAHGGVFGGQLGRIDTLHTVMAPDF